MFMNRLKVAQVGCGYWGQNLIRNFWELESAEVVMACDPDEKARELARMMKRRGYSFISLDVPMLRP